MTWNLVESLTYRKVWCTKDDGEIPPAKQQRRSQPQRACFGGISGLACTAVSVTRAVMILQAAMAPRCFVFLT